MVLSSERRRLDWVDDEGGMTETAGAQRVARVIVEQTVR